MLRWENTVTIEFMRTYYGLQVQSQAILHRLYENKYIIKILHKMNECIKLKLWHIFCEMKLIMIENSSNLIMHGKCFLGAIDMWTIRTDPNTENKIDTSDINNNKKSDILDNIM